MKLKEISVFVFAALVFLNFNAWAGDKESAVNSEKTVQLNLCTDKNLKIKFFCNPDWKLKTENEMVLMVISEEPSVTLLIGKTDSPVVNLEKLDTPTLQVIGQYAEGFKTQMIQVGSRMVIEVEGSPKDKNDAALHDFYTIHDLALYSFLFTVEPKAYKKNYDLLIQKIINNIQFLDKKAESL